VPVLRSSAGFPREINSAYAPKRTRPCVGYTGGDIRSRGGHRVVRQGPSLPQEPARECFRLGCAQVEKLSRAKGFRPFAISAQAPPLQLRCNTSGDCIVFPWA
jgi:hypothetical protein